MSAAVPTAPVHYRLASALQARLLGAAVIGLAILVIAATLVVTAADGDVVWVVLAAAVGLVAVALIGWWLRSRAYVVRCTPQGYAVRFVRGAGVREARWVDVQEATTATPHGVPCLILHLVDGRSTTIPVPVIAVDREQFVRDVMGYLRAAVGTPRR